MNYYFKVIEDNVVRNVGRHGIKPVDAEGILDIDTFADDTWPYLMWNGSAVYVDETQKAIKEAEAAATTAIMALYEVMAAEVYTAMAAVFKTTNADSAIATRETWKDMVTEPSAYSAEGLKCPEILRDAEDNVIFGIGDLLNTDQRVTDYAQRKLDQARAYGIWRIKRLDQFSDDKNAVLGV